MNDLLNSWSSTKTFATEANLMKAVEKMGVDIRGMLVVKVPSTDRYTAVFAKSMLGDNFMYVVHQGFKVLG